MDLIARVDQEARDLFGRVDDILRSAGVPGGHPVAVLAGRARVLPGDLFAGFADSDPAALTDAAGDLRALLAEYAVEHDRLHSRPAWTGPGAQAALDRAGVLAAQLDERIDTSAAAALAATARYLSEVAEWLTRAREDMAVAAARCLGSAEAATVRRARLTTAGGPPAAGPPAATPVPAGCVRAAADIAAVVLRCGLRAVAEGDDLARDWSGRLGQVGPVRMPPPAPPGGSVELPL
jgi:hypothetical protein